MKFLLLYCTLDMSLALSENAKITMYTKRRLSRCFSCKRIFMCHSLNYSCLNLELLLRWGYKLFIFTPIVQFVFDKYSLK